MLHTFATFADGCRALDPLDHQQPHRIVGNETHRLVLPAGTLQHIKRPPRRSSLQQFPTSFSLRFLSFLFAFFFEVSKIVLQMSFAKLAIAVALAAYAAPVLAHMEITEPAPLRSKINPQYSGSPLIDYSYTSPLAKDGSCVWWLWRSPILR